MGLFEVRRPSHFPSTLLKSVTAAGCHWRVSQGAMELQATMRCKKAKPINPTIFFIYILLWQSNNRWAQADGFDRYRNIGARGNLYILDIKHHRIIRPRKEQIPSLPISFNAPRLHWRWDIKHQHVHRVIGKNPVEILGTTALAQFSTSTSSRITASSVVLLVLV